MPPKRKRTTAAPDDAPIPKRQLRSRCEVITMPTPSPTKPKVASRRASSSPQKRANGRRQGTKAVAEEVVPESDDEQELKRDNARIVESTLETRYLSDETNSIRVTVRPLAEPVTPEKPKPTRGRRPRAKTIVKPETDLVEEEPVPYAECTKQDTLINPSNKRKTVQGPNTPVRRRSARSTTMPEVVLPPRSTKKANTRVYSKKPAQIAISEESSDDDEDIPLIHDALTANVNGQLSPITSKQDEQPSKAITLEKESSSSSDEHEVAVLAVESPPKKTYRSQLNPSKDFSGDLPERLHPCLNAYKRNILQSLQCPSMITFENAEETVNQTAIKQLDDLMEGTIRRAEGNSCLLLGPRGSGKSQMIDACIEKVTHQKPIILRLSGWVQTTDRHALREIAFQLLQQTGTSLLPDSEKEQASNHPVEGDEEENPFLDSNNHTSGEPTLSLPPSSHLHALIPVLLTLSRPVIVVLDAFHLFTDHPRQSLLYCLLDTAQNCRASSESRGIIVIGITSHVDTTQRLEKRVKSRFSGRTIRTAPPSNLQRCMALVTSILQPCAANEDDDENEVEWRERWSASVDKFLEDGRASNVFNETFGISREVKTITRILTMCVLRLTPSQPYLTFKAISQAAESQRSRPRTTHLTNLSYPALCLLIASTHANTAGHPNFTFEMLHDSFEKQVRALASAPVQVNGGNIGMIRCSREVLIGAFENLIAAKVFVCVVTPSSNITKPFLKYRCVVDYNDIKTIIDKAGNTNLKKWLTKNQ